MGKWILLGVVILTLIFYLVRLYLKNRKEVSEHIDETEEEEASEISSEEVDTKVYSNKFTEVGDTDIPCKGTLEKSDKIVYIEDVAGIANSDNLSLREEISGIGEAYEKRIKNWLKENNWM